MRSSTRWAIDDGLPSHVGEAMMRLSGDSNFSWISGWPSPSPSSLVTPGLTCRSTARTQSVLPLWARSRFAED